MTHVPVLATAAFAAALGVLAALPAHAAAPEAPLSATIRALDAKAEAGQGNKISQWLADAREGREARTFDGLADPIARIGDGIRGGAAKLVQAGRAALADRLPGSKDRRQSARVAIEVKRLAVGLINAVRTEDARDQAEILADAAETVMTGLQSPSSPIAPIGPISPEGPASPNGPTGPAGPASPNTGGGGGGGGGGTTASGPAIITADVGEVTTVANGNEANATAMIATAYAGDVIVSASADTVTTYAETRATAFTGLGVSYTEGSDAQAHAGVITTMAAHGAYAGTKLGVAAGGGSAQAQVKTVTTMAARNASAEAEVGVVYGRGNAYGRVGGSLTTIAGSGGSADVKVGVSMMGSSSASVGGDVTTFADAGASTRTYIGVNSNAYVRNDVLNLNGSLTIGNGITTRRGGVCITTWMGFCVWSIVPMTKSGCPPNYRPINGACYWIADYRHNIN